MRGGVVIGVMGGSSLLLLAGVMVSDYYRRKIRPNRAVSPSKHSLRQRKHVPNFEEYVNLAIPEICRQDGKGFWHKFGGELCAWHPYVSCFMRSYKSADCPRVLQVFSLIVSLYVALFCQMLLYEILHSQTKGSLHDHRGHRIVFIAFTGGIISSILSSISHMIIVRILAAKTVSWSSSQIVDSQKDRFSKQETEDVMLECTLGEELSYLLHDLRLYRSELSIENRELFNDAWGLVSEGVDVNDNFVQDPTERFKHMFDHDVYSVLVSELRRVRSEVFKENCRISDKDMSNDAKISLIINLFISDLMGNQSGRVLKWKFKKNATEIQRTSSSLKCLAWLSIIGVLVVVQWFFNYHLRDDGTGPSGLDWLFSFILWICCDVLIIKPSKVIVTEVLIPSLVIPGVKNVTQFVLKNLGHFNSWDGDEVCYIERDSFLFQNKKSIDTLIDIEYIPFNSLKYFSSSYRLASINRDILEIHFVRKYINPLPSASILENHEESVEGFQDFLACVLNFFMKLSVPFQDIVVTLSIMSLTMFCAFIFFICLRGNKVLVIIPAVVVVLAGMWICNVIVKWWTYKVHPLNDDDEDNAINPPVQEKIECEDVEELSGKKMDEILPVSMVSAPEKVNDILNRMSQHLLPEYIVGEHADGDTITTTNEEESDQTGRIASIARLVSSSHFRDRRQDEAPLASQSKSLDETLRQKVMSTSEQYKFDEKSTGGRGISFQDDLEIVEFCDTFEGIESPPSHWSDSFAPNSISSRDFVEKNVNSNPSISVFSFDKEPNLDDTLGSVENGSFVSYLSTSEFEQDICPQEYDAKNNDSLYQQYSNVDEKSANLSAGKSFMTEQTAVSKIKSFLEEQLKDKFSKDLNLYRSKMDQMVIEHNTEISNMKLQMHYLKKKNVNQEFAEGSAVSINSNSMMLDNVDELAFFKELCDSDVEDVTPTAEDKFISHIFNSLSSPSKSQKRKRDESGLSNRELRILITGFATALCDKISLEAVHNICTEERERLKIEEVDRLVEAQRKATERAQNKALEKLRIRAEQDLANEIACARILAMEKARKEVDEEICKEVAQVKSAALERAKLIAEQEAVHEASVLKAAALEKAQIQAQYEIETEVNRLKNTAIEDARLATEKARLKAEQEASEIEARILAAAEEEARLKAERKAAEDEARKIAAAEEKARMIAIRKAAEEEARLNAIAVEEAKLKAEAQNKALLIAAAEEEARVIAAKKAAEEEERVIAAALEEAKWQAEHDKTEHYSVCDKEQRRDKAIEKLGDNLSKFEEGDLSLLKKERIILQTMLQDCKDEFRQLQSNGGMMPAEDWSTAIQTLVDEMESIESHIVINRDKINEEKKHLDSISIGQDNKVLNAVPPIVKTVSPKPDVDTRKSTRRVTAMMKMSTSNGPKITAEKSLAEEFPLQKERAVLESMLKDAHDELNELYAERDNDSSFVAGQDWLDSVEDLKVEVEALESDLEANRLEIEADEARRRRSEDVTAPDSNPDSTLSKPLTTQTTLRDDVALMKAQQRESRASIQIARMSMRHMESSQRKTLRRTTTMRRMTEQGITPTLADMLPIHKERTILESMLHDSLNDLNELLSEQDEPGFVATDDWTFCVEDLREEVASMRADLATNKALIEQEEEDNRSTLMDTVAEDEEEDNGDVISELRKDITTVPPKPDVDTRKSTRRVTAMMKMSTSNGPKITAEKSLAEEFPLQKERAVLESMLKDAHDELNELYAERDNDSSFVAGQDWLDSVEDLKVEVEALESDLEANRLEIEADEARRRRSEDVTAPDSNPDSTLSKPLTTQLKQKGELSDAATRKKFEKEADKAQARLDNIQDIDRMKAKKHESRASIQIARMSMRHMESSQRKSLRRTTTLNKMTEQGITPNLANMFPLHKERTILESMLEDALNDLNELLSEQDEPGFVATDDWTFCVEDLREEVASVRADLATNKALIEQEEDDDDLYDI